MIYKRSSELFASAQKVIPGGVNSPVRAFKAVGGDPIFIKKAEGPYLYDEDGNKLIDYINSWGPLILGHAHKPVIDAVIDIAFVLHADLPEKKRSLSLPGVITGIVILS